MTKKEAMSAAVTTIELRKHRTQWTREACPSSQWIHVLLIIMTVASTYEPHNLYNESWSLVDAFVIQRHGYCRNHQSVWNCRRQQLFQSERVDDLDAISTNKYLRTEDDRIVDVDDDKTDAEIISTMDVNHDTSFANVGVGQAMQRLGVSASKSTVWTEFSRIAQECSNRRNQSVVNLGQGFPDWLPPPFAIESLVAAALESSGSNNSNSGVGSIHQYTRPAGHPNLVQQLARRYSLHMNQPIDAMKEVAVTVGASQALYLTLQVILQPGDEVILFEPFFDLYLNQIRLAGGTPVFVPLEFKPYDDNNFSGGDWTLNKDTLQQKVGPRTKAIIFNSPHNPTGKVFTLTEMEYIAESLELANPDCVVLSDEVYKYIVHSNPQGDEKDESLFCRGHIHFASLPGMWDRTITISSAGKTFSATGWQIGWCVGPSRLISRIHQLLPYVQFCASTVMQEALARSLQRADEPYEGYDSYYSWLRATYTQKRDVLAYALTKAGFAVPDFNRSAGGGFFLLARVGDKIAQNIPNNLLDVPNTATPTGQVRADWALCQWMAEEIGLLCIPSSPFFSQESARRGDYSDHFVRVAFCKTDETIAAAAEALLSLQERLPNTSKVDSAVEDLDCITVVSR
jgi:kynurenine---oxoglutarate transaminase / cysteine-S-conjugate beta-lyase / glutamine---phenylpyruvate transaminase